MFKRVYPNGRKYFLLAIFKSSCYSKLRKEACTSFQLLKQLKNQIHEAGVNFPDGWLTTEKADI